MKGQALQRRCNGEERLLEAIHRADLPDIRNFQRPGTYQSRQC